jgi:hypothetical protein
MEHMPYLPPALDPVKDMKMKDLDFMELYIKKKSILEAIEQFPCKNCPDFDTQYVIVYCMNSIIVSSICLALPGIHEGLRRPSGSKSSRSKLKRFASCSLTTACS